MALGPSRSAVYTSRALSSCLDPATSTPQGHRMLPNVTPHWLAAIYSLFFWQLLASVRTSTLFTHKTTRFKWNIFLKFNFFNLKHQRECARMPEDKVENSYHSTAVHDRETSGVILLLQMHTRLILRVYVWHGGKEWCGVKGRLVLLLLGLQWTFYTCSPCTGGLEGLQIS